MHLSNTHVQYLHGGLGYIKTLAVAWEGWVEGKQLQGRKAVKLKTILFGVGMVSSS